ncbi:hypothetical protein [Massilia sp. ZL223]|uniref:hypothetical protein n=1 Tax=Massilia sp. ZL223 TaxID=2824904 RepID=UPI001B82CB5D|nr:hypothetical protein [Massilia sp. ZL223]MBQ5965078.1 hypothetical protein [Massilia sp. ZL223]
MAFSLKYLAPAAVFLAVAGGAPAAAAFGPASQDSRTDADATTYRIIRSALQLRDVSLGVHKTCRDAAPLKPARTVGDYLAGFLAHMRSDANSISTSCHPHGGLQRCELWLAHADGDDEWKWGIRFDMDGKGKAKPSSVQCLGAG